MNPRAPLAALAALLVLASAASACDPNDPPEICNMGKPSTEGAAIENKPIKQTAEQPDKIFKANTGPAAKLSQGITPENTVQPGAQTGQIDQTVGLAGGAGLALGNIANNPAIVFARTAHLSPQMAETLGKFYAAPEGDQTGAKATPKVTEMIPQITAILAERTRDPARAQELVGRLQNSVQVAKVETLSPEELSRWIVVLEKDAAIRKMYSEGDTGNPGKKEQYERLVADRQAYMGKFMGVIPGHGTYMAEDPISATLPPKQRTDHDDAVIKNNPNSPAAYSMRSQTNLALGNTKAALDDARKAVSLDPKDGAALLSQAAAQERLGDFAGAEASARKALELDPKDKSALGILHSVEGRGAASSGASASVAGAGPAGGSGAGGGAYGNQGAGAFATGGFGSAGARGVAGMTDASTLASAAKLDEARRALSLGDGRAAEELAQRALELSGGNYAAHGFLSGLYASRGDYQRAIASASAGLALAPRDAGLLNGKAFAENRSKLYRDALATSNGAIEADSRNPYSYANRAHAYGGLGDKDAMMSDINRAASMDPRFQKAAADAAQLQLPSNSDVLFLFPDEGAAPAAAPAAKSPRSKSFGLVVGAGVLGGLLVALGLLSTVLAPLKDSVVSAFTKATRVGPSVHALEEEAGTPAAEPAAPGLVRGQYEILRQIGAGGMGTVYEGTDRSLGRRVAIKKMRDELRLNPRERERFVIEAKTVASLHHANIVDIYSIAEDGDDVYLVFEYVDGKTIHDLVQAKGRLSPADSARVTRAMGEALSYAHSKGVIHRDVKPSNVMLTADGRIKVMDFGIARMAKDALTRYSMTQNVVGTPPYMAPEQEQGLVRKESDVYSLAICSYEMLTGKLPFIGINAGMLMNKINMSYIPPSRAIAGLPAALDEVFLKAFQANPDQRYHAPLEFADALESALGGIPGRA